jgi:hypothetical protein
MKEMLMSDAKQRADATVEAQVQPAPSPSRDEKYRIAVLGRDSGAWFTWRRVYVVNPDFHGDDYSPYDAAVAGLAEARVEYPGREMRVEVLADNNDGTHSWVPVDGEA